MFAVLILVFTAQAADLEAAVRRCSSVDDSEERLACFDAAAASLEDRTAEELSSARTERQPRIVPQPRPEPASRPAPAPRAAPEESFGKAAVPANEPDAITSRIVEARLDRADKVILQLENGQVWYQVSGDRTRLREVQLGRAESVVIEKAALGSFRVTIEPLGRSFKARRVD
jgi:hypothetical protein